MFQREFEPHQRKSCSQVGADNSSSQSQEKTICIQEKYAHMFNDMHTIPSLQFWFALLSTGTYTHTTASSLCSLFSVCRAAGWRRRVGGGAAFSSTGTIMATSTDHDSLCPCDSPWKTGDDIPVLWNYSVKSVTRARVTAIMFTVLKSRKDLS